MKSQQKTKITTLVGAMALAGAITLPTLAAADEPATSLSIFLRLQGEVTNASGDRPEFWGTEGLNFGDAWTDGRPDRGNWSGLFFNAHHQMTDDTRVIARYAMNVTTEGQKDSERDIWIGVDSKRFGLIKFGREHSPYKMSTLRWDPFHATFMQARGNQGSAGSKFGTNGFIDDSVSYVHTLSGVKVSAMLGIDDAPTSEGDTNGEHLMSFAITAPVGPVELVAAYIDFSEYEGGPDDRTATKLGARYSSGPVALAAQYEMRDEGAEDGDFVLLTGSYKMGKWTHSLNYGQFTDDSGANNDGDYFAIGTKYTWTRIVSLHFGYKSSDRDIQGDDNVFGIGLRVGLNTGNLLAR